MDIQITLENVKNSINVRQIGHARHLLRDVRMVTPNRFVQGLATNTINDLNSGKFHEALRDADTAKIVDERMSYTIAL